MNAAERVIQRVSARLVRDGEWRAKCPAHQGRSNSSLSIKYTGDRVLIHCHAGCALNDILAALGIGSAAELFDTSRTTDHPEIGRRRLAAEALMQWLKREIRRVGEELRQRDVLARRVHDSVQLDAMNEGEAWDCLQSAYCGYAE